jgi:hypothetical protein
VISKRPGFLLLIPYSFNKEQGAMKRANKTVRWYGLVVLPVDCRWPGTRRLAKIMDELQADPQSVVFSSQDKKEVWAMAEKPPYRDRFTDIIELDYNPNLFSITSEYAPAPDRQLRAMKRLAGEEEARP